MPACRSAESTSCSAVGWMRAAITWKSPLDQVCCCFALTAARSGVPVTGVSVVVMVVPFSGVVWVLPGARERPVVRWCATGRTVGSAPRSGCGCAGRLPEDVVRGVGDGPRLADGVGRAVGGSWRQAAGGRDALDVRRVRQAVTVRTAGDTALA